MDKFNKLNEAISELGWDVFFIKDPSDSIKGAVVGPSEFITYLTEKMEKSDEPQSVNLDKEELMDLEKIYHTMILKSNTGFWISEIDPSGSIEFKSYDSQEEISNQITEAFSNVDQQLITDIKINSLYPYCMNIREGTVIMFPSEELCRMSYRQIKLNQIEEKKIEIIVDK